MIRIGRVVNRTRLSSLPRIMAGSGLKTQSSETDRGQFDDSDSGDAEGMVGSGEKRKVARERRFAASEFVGVHHPLGL